MFITFEGIDGSGKSTCIEKVAYELGQRFSERKITVTSEPREPYRKLIFDRGIEPISELLLFNVDRAEHLAKVVKPGLRDGGIVLCDRYVHSTLAYQMSKHPIKLIRELHAAIGGSKPDLLVYFDLDPVIALERLSDREKDKFETLERLKKVRHCYEWAFCNYRTNRVVVNASQNAGAVALTAFFLIEQAIEARDMERESV